MRMEPIVDTASGQAQGQWSGNIATFLGLPYAAPPVGEDRFGPPRRHPNWEGIKDARSFGATAPQAPQDLALITEPVIAGDNCLNLNVFTPDPGPAARLPVMVWIHGGGFFSGCSANPWYRGERFARDGVVLVSINYRLGLEGFLKLDDEGGNRGVLDWIAALEWVQENIGRFGGDPANVTIAGQSAGGTACEILTTIPSTHGLFRRAVCMSAPSGLAGTAEMAASLARRAADYLGVPLTRRSLADVLDGRLEEARAHFTPSGPGAVSTPSVAPLAPYVDGDLIPEVPLQAMAAGAGAQIDLLAGATTQELNMFFAASTVELTDDSLRNTFVSMGLADDAARVYKEALPGKTLFAVLGQAVGDHMFRIHASRIGSARHDAGARTFLYEWAWRSPGMDGVLGAGHGVDVPFAFDNLDAPGGERALGANPPQDLADLTHRAYVDFATAGDPGWPSYTADERATMVFDDDCRVVNDPFRTERELWGA
jgi:para-nitrobenzyl esterase